jgi:hypothetical protein
MVDVLGFISYLQTTTAHTKVHSIHIDLTREGLLVARLGKVCVDVFEDGYEDLDLITSVLSD